MKFISFQKNYYLKSFLNDGKKRHPSYSFYILLEKNEKNFLFFVQLKETFQTLLGILRRFCILTDFLAHYVTFKLLGEGHFAEVISVRDKMTDEMRAVKILKKNRKEFDVNKVRHFYNFFFITVSLSYRT